MENYHMILSQELYQNILNSFKSLPPKLRAEEELFGMSLAIFCPENHQQEEVIKRKYNNFYANISDLVRIAGTKKAKAAKAKLPKPNEI